MENHYFDAHGRYVGCAVANPGARPPLNALRLRPPEKEGYWPVVNGGGDGWELREDHRGRRGWVNGEERIVDDLGPLPDGWSDAPPALPETVTPEERRAAAYRSEADPHRDAALSYRAEAEGWRLLGEEEKALAAEARASDHLLRYIGVKQRIRDRDAETPDSPPAAPWPERENADERFYLTRKGTYHRQGCAYTTAVGEWLFPAEITARRAGARPCTRCEPPVLAGTTRVKEKGNE